MSTMHIEEIIPGCVLLSAQDRNLVFGVPSDVVKFFSLQKKDFGRTIILPDKLYDRGTIQSVEFPLYRFIFKKDSPTVGEKFTIIGTAKQIAQITAILQQTVLGPSNDQYREWSTNGEDEFLKKIRSYFRKDFQSLGEIIDFIAFDSRNQAKHDGFTITRMGGDHFEVAIGNVKAVVDVNPSEQRMPPVDYAPPSSLIRPMGLGALILGASSGFDPKGDTSNIIIYANHLGISIDGTPWMAERLNLFGIPPGDIKLFIVTHLHDDHSNIFHMMIHGYRSTIATTNLIYRSFLVKASSILNIPIEGVEKLVHFIELKPGKRIKWFSNEIECFYTVHPIPTIGVCINGKILFSGDTLWGKPLNAIVGEGLLERDYADFLQELPTRKGLELIFMDCGGGPIHPHADELACLPPEIRKKMYLTHLSDMEERFKYDLRVGRAGEIFRLDDIKEKLDFEDVLALSESTLMKEAPPEWIRVFCSTGVLVEKSAGEVIVHQDEAGEFFYFLLRGTLKVVRAGKVVTRIYSGDYFGEMVFLGSKKRTASLISESPVKVLAIPRQVFRDFIADERVKKNLRKITMYRPDFFQTSIFSETPEKYLEQIILRCRHKKFKPGEIIVREGDIGDEFFLIIDGSCEVSRLVMERKSVMKILGKYEVFGEMALLSESKIRRATVTAMEPTEVAIISHSQFNQIIEEIPSVFYNLTVIMDERRIIEPTPEGLDCDSPL
jgi:CRP-like cAMP-binding protein